MAVIPIQTKPDRIAGRARCHESNDGACGSIGATASFRGSVSMRVSSDPRTPPRSWPCCQASARLACAGAVRAADEPRQPIRVQFTLDRPIDAAAAPFVMAQSTACSAPKASPSRTNRQPDRRMRSRACRQGTQRYRAGRHQRTDPLPRQGQGRQPACQGGVHPAQRERPTRSSPAGAAASSVADLQGKTLGVAEGDLAIQAVAGGGQAERHQAAERQAEKIGAAVREPMLSAGQVDAVSGIVVLSAINLRTAACRRRSRAC